MFEDFREANAVALYDSQTLITKNGFEHLFHEFDISRTVINIDVLDDIAQYFDLPIDKSHLGKLDTLELIYKETYHYLSDAIGGTIEKILVKPEGRFLSIVIVENWENPEATIRREILYSGKFSIDFGEAKITE